MRRGRFAGLIQPSPQERLQFFRTFFLWHLPLRTFLAHFRLAHLPGVSGALRPCTLPGSQYVMSLGHPPVYDVWHAPVVRLTQTGMVDVQSWVRRSTQPQCSMSGVGGDAGGGGGDGGGGEGDGAAGGGGGADGGGGEDGGGEGGGGDGGGEGGGGDGGGDGGADGSGALQGLLEGMGQPPEPQQHMRVREDMK